MGGQQLEHYFNERNMEWREVEFGDKYRKRGYKANLLLYSDKLVY